MTKDDPIVCFNGEECCYNSGVCGLYEYRTEVCIFEGLKNFLKEKLPQMVPFEKKEDGSVENAPEKKLETPTEVLIKKILGTNPKLTREAVERLVQEEKAKSSGLLTEEAAAFVVLQNLGERKRVLAANDPPTNSEFISAAKLVEGTKNVSIQGTVVSELVSKEVNTQRGPTNLVSFLVATDSGDVRVSIWSAPELTSNVAEGDPITIENVMVSAPYDGRPQVSGNKYTKVIAGEKQPGAPTQRTSSERGTSSGKGEWKPTKKGGGEWAWSNNNAELANRIIDNGGKLTEGGYSYSLYGDIGDEGIKKCISRYPDKKGRR